MQIFSVPVFTQPDTVDITDQDCLVTLRETSLVQNSACYPSPHLTINSCCQTCFIPTDIKFGMIFDEVYVLNKASPYIIKFVDWIVTFLSFLCCCIIIAEFFYSFLFGVSANSLCPVKFHHRSHHPSTSNDKLFHCFHPVHHPLKCIHHGK